MYRPSESSSRVSEGEPGLRLAATERPEYVSRLNLPSLRSDSLASDASSSAICSSGESRIASPFTASALTNPCAAGSVYVSKAAGGGRTSVARARRAFFVCIPPVSSSRSSLCPDRDLVSCRWTYSSNASSSLLVRYLWSTMRNAPIPSANRPEHTSSLNQETDPTALQDVTLSGSKPLAIRNMPRTRKTTPRWSIPTEETTSFSVACVLRNRRRSRLPVEQCGEVTPDSEDCSE